MALSSGSDLGKKIIGSEFDSVLPRLAQDDGLLADGYVPTLGPALNRGRVPVFQNASHRANTPEFRDDMLCL